MSQIFTFPTFRQMFPYEKRAMKLFRESLRYRMRKFLYAAQCRQLVQFLNQNPMWQAMFTQHYYRVNTLLSEFCDRQFSAQQRLDAILNNFRVSEQQFGEPLCRQLLAEQRILLSPLTEDLDLFLNINQIDPYEGFLALSILDKTGKMIYAGSFIFLANNKLLIASIQGPRGDEAQDIVRVATKSLHGVRPMFMLLNGFKVLAEVLNCELLGIPHKRQAKYRWNSSSKLLFNYDEFWQENAGELNEKYWQIPTALECRPLEEIQSKKRSMYRKRYQMFDSLSNDMQLIFKAKNNE